MMFVKLEVEIIMKNLSISEICNNNNIIRQNKPWERCIWMLSLGMKTYQCVVLLSDTVAAELKQLDLP